MAENFPERMLKKSQLESPVEERYFASDVPLSHTQPGPNPARVSAADGRQYGEEDWKKLLIRIPRGLESQISINKHTTGLALAFVPVRKRRCEVQNAMGEKKSFLTNSGRFVSWLQKVPKRFWATAVCIAVGMLLVIDAFHREQMVGRLTSLSLVEIEIGVAFVIAGIAEFILLEHASADMNRQTTRMLDDLRNDFNIITRALGSGLTDLMGPRRVEDSTRDLLCDVLRRTRGEVRIMGVSLGDFLDGGQPLNRVLQMLMNNDEGVKIRMLLMDPFHSNAKLRSRAEQGPSTTFENSYLYANMKTSIASLRDFTSRKKHTKNFDIDARFFNIHPPYYMMSTPDVLFFEPYHLGRVGNDGPCIGGFVPTFRFSQCSTMYFRSQRHFDYVWHSTADQAKKMNEEGDWYDGEYLCVRSLDEIVKQLDLLNGAGKMDESATIFTPRSGDTNGRIIEP
jgi:hypothetical protein